MKERMLFGDETMYRIVIFVFIVGLLSGCVQTRSSINRGDARSALWGKVVEADGTEYFRVGNIHVDHDARRKVAVIAASIAADSQQIGDFAGNSVSGAER